MAFDFWNNPLVVSALRVKYRKRGLFLGLMVYVSFVGCAFVAAWYLIPWFNGAAVDDALKLQWMFMGLLIGQAIVSVLVTVTGTSTAMAMEVNDGTLDYQRLTKLTPLE